MKNCVYCNNQIEDNATYCIHCGKQQPATPYYPQQPPRQSNNNILYLIIGILGTAVLLIGGYLIYSMMSDSKAAKEEEVTEVKRDTVVQVIQHTEEAKPAVPAAPPKVYTIEGSHHMRGSISKYGLTMDISVSGNDVYGTYYYHSVGSKNRMTVTGNIYGNNMHLEEYSPDGINTGCFDGTFNGQVFKGRFTNYSKGTNMSFTITEK